MTDVYKKCIFRTLNDNINPYLIFYSKVTQSKKWAAIHFFSVLLSETKHQVILLDKDIDGYKKSINAEQEQNEILTLQLNWSQMDCTTTRKLINDKQAQQEALQAHYSTFLLTLQETERTLARLSKVSVCPESSRGTRLETLHCLILFLSFFNLTLNFSRNLGHSRLKWTIRVSSWRKRVLHGWSWKTTSWAPCSTSSSTTTLPSTPNCSLRRYPDSKKRR